MEPKITTAIIAGLVSILISSVISVWTRKKHVELDYDMKLQEARLNDYKSLWALTEVSSLFREKEIEDGEAEQLFKDLNIWYFKSGNGLLLSESSLKALEDFMNQLNSFSHTNQSSIQRAGVVLRSKLTQDVGGIYSPKLGKR